MAETEVTDTPAEESGEQVDQSADESGSQHFAIGDLPPGAEATESAEETTEEDSSGVTNEEVDVATPPTFFTFKTVDGKEKTFASEEEAQQFFSSWNGRLSKAERDLNSVTALNTDWQNAYAKGELTPSQEKIVEKAADKVAEAAAPGALEQNDWSVVAKMIKGGEGEKALQYVNWKNGEFLKSHIERIEADVAKRFEDLEAPAKFQSDVANAMSYVAQAGQAAVDDMGQPMFPEFQEGDKYDKNFVMHFRDIWLNMDYKTAADPSGSGFKAAYYEAKHSYVAPEKEAGKAADFIAPPDGTVSPPRNPDGTFAKRNAALSMSGAEGATPSKPGSGTKVKGDDILTGLRETGVSRNPHFAVAPE